jgi:hypothetical protein
VARDRRHPHKAIYWANQTSDGYGGFTFDAGVEIDTRWEQKAELFIDKNGAEAHSSAVVFIANPLQLGAFIRLGPIFELTSDQLANPNNVSGALEIRQTSRVTTIDGAKAVNKVWL